MRGMMNHRMRLIWRKSLGLLTLCLVSVAAFAQMVDVSNFMNLSTDHTGGFLGAGVSFADFNGDRIDDLSFAHHQGSLRFFEGTGNEDGFLEVDLDLPAYAAEAKMILWSDIDNDGDQDLFITYRLAPNKMFRNDKGSFVDVSATCGINQGARKSYGACFGDYDKDGFLDLFVANYTSSFDEYAFNELYRNEGDGTFEDVTESSGMFEVTGIQSFQGQWVDFNGDQLLDLHVIRDRIIYANHFFEQQPEGAITPFIESANVLGLDMAINCMSTSVSDYDGDLDMDVYITAFPGDENWMLVNNDYAFSAVNEDSGEIPMQNMQVDAICWAGNWLDVDNNGWEDLHVANGYSVYTNYPQVLGIYNDEPDALFYNTAGEFTEADEPQFQTESTLSFATAVGDYNRDGSPDLVSHAVGEFAQVLRGTPNTNHWVKILLEGTESNRDGIGAKVIVHTSDGSSQLRMTYAGENYLGQNSRWEAFGLGDVLGISSVEVQWPSGTTTTHTGIVMDQHWLLAEDGASTQLWQIDPCLTDGLCPGCTYPEACNFYENANVDDGSCTFDCFDVPNSCGPGTVWDEAMGWCVSSTDCPYDFDGSGYVTVADLLIFLIGFNQQCPD